MILGSERFVEIFYPQEESPDRQHRAFAGISLLRLRTGIEDDDPKYHDHYPCQGENCQEMVTPCRR